MNKKILGVVLTISAIIAVAAIAPALANNLSNQAATGTEYVYATGGNVILQLPPGGGPLQNRPTSLRIGAHDVDRRSTNGIEDYISIYVWVPSVNKYQSIAIISDNPGGIASMKKIFSGIPYFQNVILVADNELEIWTESTWTSYGGHKDWDHSCSETLVVNLTKAIDIKIGDPASQAYKDLNFTLPPMTLTFRGIGDTFKEEISTALKPSPPLSGWSYTEKKTNEPAWVSISIPTWLGSTEIPAVGTRVVRSTMVLTPPPAP